MKRPFVTAILIVLCSCFVRSARAQNGTSPQEKGTIAGMVVDALSDQPIKAAYVRLRGVAADSTLTPENDAEPAITDTDPSGRFVFDGLPAGRYILLASHDGYVNNHHDNARLRGDLISLAPGQHLTDVVLRLLPDGAIAGHITDEAGKPLRGVSVQAMKSSYLRGRREFHDVVRDVTNAAGDYRISSVPPGKYFLRFKPPASLTAKSTGDKTYIPLYYPAVSDQSRSVPIVLRAGEELAGIDMNLRPVRTVRIRGTVFNARTSLPSKEAQVTLLSDQGETVFAAGKNVSVGGQANFEFQGVPPGSYVVVAQQPSDSQDRKTMWGRTAVEVKDANLEHEDVVVSSGVDISGRIRMETKTTLDSSQEDPGTDDLSKTVGILQPQDASALARLTPDIDNATVSANGNFIFREVPEGSYRIDFVPIPAGYYLKSSGTADVLETGITVSRGHAPSGLELVLSPGAGRVDGTAISDEQPVPNATVVLVPDGKGRGQPSYYRQSVTDQLGRFSMRNIVPGDYTLFAFEQIERGAYFDPEFIGQFEDRGKAIHVEESGHVSVQLEVIPAGETVP
jgi:hypothetical protein